jgi:hypothetical protein
MSDSVGVILLNLQRSYIFPAIKDHQRQTDRINNKERICKTIWTLPEFIYSLLLHLKDI